MNENTLLQKLYELIDKKFSRENRKIKIDPLRLKNKITLYAISSELIGYSPDMIVKYLKILIERGSVKTNIEDEGINPFDAYFIPVAELEGDL